MRSRTDLAEFERQCMTHLPDTIKPIKVEETVHVPPEPTPTPPPKVETPPPIEKLIVEEEAPHTHMKIRITSKQ